MKTNEVKTKRVHNLIIVDESGSMEVIRKQAFVGMNETLCHPAYLRQRPHHLALRQPARCTDQGLGLESLLSRWRHTSLRCHR